MGKAIRGITVEIGGDTTKLGKALSGVNTQAKNLQTELKGVNSLLKMDPSNVTLLKQKQDLLNQAISTTKEKLDTLKKAQEQVQEQFDKGEITEEQFRDFQREIVATEGKLGNLTDELETFGSVGAQQVALVGQKMQDVGGKVESVGKKFSIISAGAGLVIGGSISAFNELDSGYDTIITKTGATGEALDGLNNVANNIFGDMPTDMDTVGTAVGEVNTRFGLTGEKLDGLSRQFIEFSEINGVDLNSSIATVDKVLEQFNMTGDDAGGVLDLITKKAQETGISAETLMSAIQDNGATFKDMGLGVNESVLLLSQFEANGVNVETALKGLKKATVEYSKEGLSMEEGLSKTISSIKNAKSDTEALAIAQELFGTRGAGEMSRAIREGRISVEDLTASMDDYSGTVTDTFNATLDPIDDSKVAMNNLKLAGSELGGALQTTFAPILTTIVEKLKGLVNWFGNLSPETQKIIVIVLAVVAVLGPLIIIVGKLISSFGTIMTLAPKIVSGFNKLKTVLGGLSGTTGLIILAITALVAGFIYLWNNCEGFRNFWLGLWEKVKTAFSNFVTWITPIIETVKTALVEGFKKAWETIKAVWDYVQPYFTIIWEGIKTVFSVVAQVLGTFFTTAWNVIKAVWDAVKPYFSAIWSGIKAVFSVVSTVLGGFFRTAWTAIKAVWNTVGGFFETIWATIEGIFSVVKNVLSGNFSGAWEAIKGIVGKWGDFFKGVWKSIKNVFSSVGTWFSDIFSGAWDAVKNVFASWGSFFSGLWDSICTTFSDIGTNISEAIGGAVTGAINGVIGAIEDVINGGIGLINGAIDLINLIPGVDIGHLDELSFPRLARGGIVNRPTFAEIGEDGAEAVIPLEKNTQWLRNVAKELNDHLIGSSNNGALIQKLDDIYTRLDRLQIVLDTGTLVGETIDKIDTGLADRQLLSARGV